ncbi:Zinc finger BED domain-containing protein 5 [Trichinella zimbabwensis]|uniref:Zinc finger BED domain-containing protein 5 n=1 Tax=Trichinella zimbabwensis TaxID=268475 RepID=A0A0V1I1M4_9BILA|nr:Zinc finger BED domain-containing protein 5 [Trichinella zimbabwensis]
MSKTMPDELKNVLNEVITEVTFIKASAICKESGSEFETLLLHCHMKWLSKDITNFLKRIFILREAMQQVLQDAKPDMNAKFSYVHFLISLSFLVDIFESVNSINLALQGKEISVLHCHEKLAAFKMKHELWHAKLEKKLVSFLQMNAYIDENELNVDDDILEVMKQHVSIYNF